MDIPYTTKTKKKYKDPEIEATIIEYRISKESMEAIIHNRTPQEEKWSYNLINENSNVVDLVIDAPNQNRIVAFSQMAGQIFLQLYIVHKGLEELVYKITHNNSLD